MFWNVLQKWILVAVFTNVFTPASMQVAMYMAGPHPVYAVPAQMPIAVAIQFQEPVTETTTTTTTTQASMAIAVPVPVPVPMPVQFAVPAHPPPVFCQGNPRPRSCPPCPPCVCMPSCTPSFFSYCSSCHLKCRCRSAEDAPIPMPPNRPVPVPGAAYPMPVPVAASPIVAPPPVVVIPLPPSRSISVPLPPRRRKRRFPHSLSSSNTDDSDSSCDISTSIDSDTYFRGRKGGKKFKRRRTQIYRRNARPAKEDSDTDVVKPVISYIAKNGDIKFETQINSREAREILNKNKSKKQILNVVANENSIMLSNSGPKSGKKYKKVLLRDGTVKHVLKEGNNELILKPPGHKKINNLAVSFQVS